MTNLVYRNQKPKTEEYEDLRDSYTLLILEFPIFS